ncbi:hypothetical protein [Nostoc sp.]|uniref:hypothetical protein n=1 Tax=Nostoc sp. TaxID=1180 RepID=UPI002FF99641
MKKIAKNILHPRQEHKRRQAERQDRQQGEQQQGESSLQPPPGLASSSQQATTPARPPLQSSSVSSLTPSRFSREFTAQNEGRDSVDSNRSIPRYMLHGTSESNAANILETGLQTSYGGQEGGASRKMNDPKYIENSQGVVHGTPSRKVANAYAEYHDKLSAGGESIEKNSAFIGFRNVHPELTKRDPNSRASYTISQSIPSNQVVPVRPEKVAEGEDPTGLFMP